MADHRLESTVLMRLEASSPEKPAKPLPFERDAPVQDD
jgi:hypothetical protein